MVVNGKINMFDLETAINSDLMFSHVCDILMELGFVILDGPLQTVSSTNVAMMHRIVRQVGDAHISTKAWLHDVSEDVLELIDKTARDNAAHTRVLAALRAHISGLSVAWALCKVGTVMSVALGGETKLRNNHTNPIKIARNILLKLQ